MKYVFDQSELVANFVAQMIPHVRNRGFGNCTAIGMTETIGGRDELIAGLVYHHFDIEADNVMEISGAALPGKQWATRETLRIMHVYPFGQLRCQMVIMRVARDDEKLLHQLLRLGYSFIEFPRMLGRHRDGVICHLTDDKWRENRITKRLLRQSQHQSQQHQSPQDQSPQDQQREEAA
jgi:hypothetical protein